MTKQHYTHHYHHKKRTIPQPKKPKRDAVDYFVYFFMFISPLFELPQAIDIYSQRTAEDVSLATWFLFFMASIAWLIYGIRNHLKLIIVVQIVYMIIEAWIVIGILRFQ